MFVIDRDNNISVTRGDTALIQLDVYRTDRTKREFRSTDTVTMTVKKCMKDEKPILTLTGNKKGLIKIKPENYIINSEGELIRPGNYMFDVELKTESGAVYTVVPTRKLTIVKPVRGTK